MSDQGQGLQRRVGELEGNVARLRAARPRSIRYRSLASLGGYPLVSVALGPNLEKGEMRGHARGVIAIGDIASGGIAIGGVAVGGISIGLASLGGLALGLLLALGGGAIGGTALGGAAVGKVAVGGGAAGEYACGGAAYGKHVVDSRQRDPEAMRFFEEHGLGQLCAPGR
jgi:hypothetical protein